MEKPYCKKLLQVERMSHFLAEIMSLTKSLFCFVSCRPLFGEVQLINPSRAALVPVLPLSPENSQNNIANAPHPGDIHPAYRIPYMQLLHTLHSATSPQSSLHGEWKCLFCHVSCIKLDDSQQRRILRRKTFHTRVRLAFPTHSTASAMTSTWNAWRLIAAMRWLRAQLRGQTRSPALTANAHSRLRHIRTCWTSVQWFDTRRTRFMARKTATRVDPSAIWVRQLWTQWAARMHPSALPCRSHRCRRRFSTFW